MSSSQSPAAGRRINSRQASGDRFDRRKRIVQLVPQHAHQPLPGLQFFFAQRPREVGDHQQLMRQAAFAERAARNAPAARCCREGALDRLRLALRNSARPRSAARRS